MSKKYIKEEGTPLLESIGSTLSTSQPSPGKHSVSVKWNVEHLWKLKDKETGREWTLSIPPDKVQNVNKDGEAVLTVGLSDGVVVFHNAGKWTAKEVPSNEVMLDNVSFKEIISLFRQGDVKAAVPIVERLEGINETKNTFTK